MPIYEYRCDSCGHALEKLQKASDPALTECPACGQPALKKLISAAGFRLKGSGWYETDFKKANQKNLHESGEKSEKGEQKETKPAETGGASAPAADKTPPAKPSAKQTAA